MNKIRNLIAGLTLVSLLAVALVAVAGNGFGGSSDWDRPFDGSGYGKSEGFGQGNAGSRPMDGSGYGAGQGSGLGQGLGNGMHAGGK